MGTFVLHGSFRKRSTFVRPNKGYQVDLGYMEARDVRKPSNEGFLFSSVAAESAAILRPKKVER